MPSEQRSSIPIDPLSMPSANARTRSRAATSGFALRHTSWAATTGGCPARGRGRLQTTSTWASRGADRGHGATYDMATSRWEIVRSSGICAVCDFKFIDEIVAGCREPGTPAGWVYVELRHFD